MIITFDTKYYIGNRSFKINTATRVIQKILKWYESFKPLIVNDGNIFVEEVCIDGGPSDIFCEHVTITIRMKAYERTIEEKIHFSFKDIFSPQKPKGDFDSYVTARLVEKLEAIKKSINRQSLTINETMGKLKPV